MFSVHCFHDIIRGLFVYMYIFVCLYSEGNLTVKRGLICCMFSGLVSLLASVSLSVCGAISVPHENMCTLQPKGSSRSLPKHTISVLKTWGSKPFVTCRQSQIINALLFVKVRFPSVKFSGVINEGIIKISDYALWHLCFIS